MNEQQKESFFTTPIIGTHYVRYHVGSYEGRVFKVRSVQVSRPDNASEMRRRPLNVLYPKGRFLRSSSGVAEEADRWKVCKRCNNDKPPSAFGRAPGGTLRTYCKPCDSERAKEVYRERKRKEALAGEE